MFFRLQFDTKPWVTTRNLIFRFQCGAGKAVCDFDYTRMGAYTGKPPWRRLRINSKTIFEVNADLSGLPGAQASAWRKTTIDVFGRRIVGRKKADTAVNTGENDV